MKKTHMPVTALHRGLPKYLTAQDTHVTPTLAKHDRTLARLGDLLPPTAVHNTSKYDFSVPC